MVHLSTFLKLKPASSKNKKEGKSSKKPKVHKDLEGFEIKVNPQGEIITNYNIDQINEFLNKNVEDKKLQKRDAAEKAKREEEEAYHIEESEEVEETDEDFVKNTNAVTEDEDDIPIKKKRKDDDDVDDEDL